MSEAADNFEVLVVGAGPGGITAALTCAEAGKRVGLVDDAPFAGGQIWRNRGEPAKARAARRWLTRLDAACVSGNIACLRQSRVIANPAVNVLQCETPEGSRRIGWKSLILAPGARELFLPFPGWTLPGVFGAGAMQALMKQGLSVTGKRVIVAGTGPLLLAVADLLRSRGAIVPMLLEQAPAKRINRFALSLLRTPAKLAAGIALRARLIGCRYSTGSYPLRASATATGLQLAFCTPKGEAMAECDYLACGFNLIPNNELPQLLGCELARGGFVRVDRELRTSVPNIYAIGEVTGIGGLDKSIVEGQIAAHSIAGDDRASKVLSDSHASARDFTERLESAFALRPELLKLAEPDTIICRCEDVRLSVIGSSINARDAKLQTRCGMGPCQGRVCGPILQRMLGAEPQQVRPPVFAATLGMLAGTCPRSGYSEAAPAQAIPALTSRPAYP